MMQRACFLPKKETGPFLVSGMSIFPHQNIPRLTADSGKIFKKRGIILENLNILMLYFGCKENYFMKDIQLYV